MYDVVQKGTMKWIKEQGDNYQSVVAAFHISIMTGCFKYQLCKALKSNSTFVGGMANKEKNNIAHIIATLIIL